VTRKEYIEATKDWKAKGFFLAYCDGVNPWGDFIVQSNLNCETATSAPRTICGDSDLDAETESLV
jgi:hypothetical protein